ncbi:hypothetical protein F0L74_16590 [Chitinophaga agrisoli]|uniref:Uncharacterized protein n=1 Tax=Chitinophaga agrisoli TaxID=2607653 RepID=A0A5B2VP74_9BACT|nr:hypothetical protein [Chitinophaga agrisoli]KAA2241513.1 hypothetical protein F0L74_16590 [Chitinophaga agrisoli]
MKIDDNLLKLAALIISLITAGAFIAIRISKKRNNTSSNNVITQSNNTVGKGDIVAGNKTSE